MFRNWYIREYGLEKREISVIMSVYNSEKYLSEAIESVLNQSFSNFEFLITNDCSTDNSSILLEKYSKIDSRIKILNNKSNIGLTKSLNKMVKLSKGKYIARMDSDDICREDRFEKELELIKKSNADVVFSNCEIIDSHSNKVCNAWKPNDVNKILKNINYINYIPHPSVLLNKQSLIDMDFYNENCKTGQDKELWKRMINANKIFQFINLPLLKYRLNPKSVRNIRSSDENYDLAKICIVNRDKKNGIKYMKLIKSKKSRIDIFIRILVPCVLFKLIVNSRAHSNSLRKAKTIK